MSFRAAATNRGETRIGAAGRSRAAGAKCRGKITLERLGIPGSLPDPRFSEDATMERLGDQDRTARNHARGHSGHAAARRFDPERTLLPGGYILASADETPLWPIPGSFPTPTAAGACLRTPLSRLLTFVAPLVYIQSK